MQDKLSLYRVLDANINRAQEGLRVCEDIARFMLNNRNLASQIKRLRHRMNRVILSMPVDKKKLLKSRDIKADIGKKSTTREMTRKDFKDILYANIQRIKESLRVLEEFLKLIDKKIAEKIKHLRYETYEIEKKITLKI